MLFTDSFGSLCAERRLFFPCKYAVTDSEFFMQLVCLSSCAITRFFITVPIDDRERVDSRLFAFRSCTPMLRWRIMAAVALNLSHIGGAESTLLAKLPGSLPKPLRWAHEGIAHTQGFEYVCPLYLRGGSTKNADRSGKVGKRTWSSTSKMGATKMRKANDGEEESQEEAKSESKDDEEDEEESEEERPKGKAPKMKHEGNEYWASLGATGRNEKRITVCKFRDLSMYAPLRAS
jgi:hypothetical protein